MWGNNPGNQLIGRGVESQDPRGEPHAYLQFPGHTGVLVYCKSRLTMSSEYLIGIVCWEGGSLL